MWTSHEADSVAGPCAGRSAVRRCLFDLLGRRLAAVCMDRSEEASVVEEGEYAATDSGAWQQTCGCQGDVHGERKGLELSGGKHTAAICSLSEAYFSSYRMVRLPTAHGLQPLNLIKGRDVLFPNEGL